MMNESLNLAKLVSCKYQYHKGFLSRFFFLVLIQESTCIELGLVNSLNRERHNVEQWRKVEFTKEEKV